LNKGGGIGEVTVYVNGSEAIKDARPENSDPDSQTLTFKVYIADKRNIAKGYDNYIAVKAWNKDHWVVSRGEVVTFKTGAIENYKPAIHIFTIGVSDYLGDELDLKYAAKDAEDIQKALQLGAKQLFGTQKSYVYNLSTSQPKDQFPTKENILKAFEKISTTAHPLDIFVMYMSGHGINFGGPEGDWYYLTQEAHSISPQAYNDPAIRQKTTLSSDELVELFKTIPALKQVLIIDACAAGKVVDNLMNDKDISSTTLRALDRMKDRTGLHLITGCTADAVSYEASKYGQGVLTYSILEGIRGASLRENRYIDINTLFQYAQERVPVLATGIGGIQKPQVFSPHGSQSFDIGELNEGDKKEVPLATIRPVYIRSNFQDEFEPEDLLGLGKKVDKVLNEESSKGIEALIIFVDVSDYPESCRLSGRYTQGKGEIKLKVRKKCGDKAVNFELTGKDIEELQQKLLKIL